MVLDWTGLDWIYLKILAIHKNWPPKSFCMKENRRRHVLQDPLRSHQTVQKTIKLTTSNFLHIGVVHCGLRIPALPSSLLCLLLLRWLIRVISAPPDNTACLESYALYLTSDPPIEMNKQFETNRNRKREREHPFLSSKHLWEVNLLKRQRLRCRNYTQHFYQDCSITK